MINREQQRLDQQRIKLLEDQIALLQRQSANSYLSNDSISDEYTRSSPSTSVNQSTSHNSNSSDEPSTYFNTTIPSNIDETFTLPALPIDTTTHRHPTQNNMSHPCMNQMKFNNFPIINNTTNNSTNNSMNNTMNMPLNNNMNMNSTMNMNNTMNMMNNNNVMNNNNINNNVNTNNVPQQQCQYNQYMPTTNNNCNPNLIAPMNTNTVLFLLNK